MLSAILFISAALAEDDVDKGNVIIESTVPSTRISAIVGRGTGSSSTGATVVATFTQDVCIAPCNVEVDRGMYEFFVDDPDSNTVALSQKFEVRDEPLTIQVSPGNRGLRQLGEYTMYAGVTLAIIGGMYGYMFEGIPPEQQQSARLALGGGIAVTGGGIALMRANRGSWSTMQ